MTETRRELSPIYRRLPHGPNAMAREEVERNQRSRLCGAMIEAVARNGYEGTTVAHVIALAGVSRRAFYELFANKEECFLGTYDVMVAHVRRRLLHAWSSERGWENRMHASCRSLLSDIARAPKGPRLVLVDSLGIGQRARERMELVALVFERIVASAFSRSPERASYPPLTSRVLVTGVRNVLFNRLREHRHRELPGLSEELLDWVEAYRVPAGLRLRTLTAAAAAYPPPVPAAFLAGEDRRARLLGSVVHLTLDRGYAALSDPQIAQFAGLSTEAFHRHFRDKEECFLAVLDEFVAETLARVRPSLESAESWEEATCRGMRAFVTHLATHQALLQIAFIDVFEVGPAMIGRINRSVADFIAMLTEGAPAPVRGSRIAQEAVTGAVWGVISSFVSSGRRSRLTSLTDHLTFTVLAPYIGPRRALEALAVSQRPASAAR